nr:signal peptidase I [uncultured Anaerotignum sp.]
MMENEMELQEEQAAEKRKKEKKGMPVLLQLVLLVVLALLLRNVMGTVLVKGSSMEPNFYHGDFVFINKLSTAFGSLQKGDVVICRLDEEKKNIIKRVIGLPGDVIDFRETDGGEDTIYALYINDELVQEDYIKAPMDSKGNIDYPYTVPENSYFVMGDNRNASSDSRRKSVGAIEKEDLMGKVIFRLYPFGSMGFIK